MAKILTNEIKRFRVEVYKYEKVKSVETIEAYSRYEAKQKAKKLYPYADRFSVTEVE